MPRADERTEREQLFRVGAVATRPAEFLRRGELQIKLAVLRSGAASRRIRAPSNAKTGS
jgi:hypothetical protein